jgi:hypothetical protein
LRDARFFFAGAAASSPSGASSAGAVFRTAFFLRVTFFLRGFSSPSEMAPKGSVPSALVESFDVT